MTESSQDILRQLEEVVRANARESLKAEKEVVVRIPFGDPMTLLVRLCEFADIKREHDATFDPGGDREARDDLFFKLRNLAEEFTILFRRDKVEAKWIDGELEVTTSSNHWNLKVWPHNLTFNSDGSFVFFGITEYWEPGSDTFSTWHRVAVSPDGEISYDNKSPSDTD